MAIKERIGSFLKRENGKISKRSIITIGAIVGTAAVASVITPKIVKGLSAVLNPPEGRPVTIRGSY